jgi:hypothetical protein
MDICLAAARAAASRRNGAKSRGPKTAEGKARSAQNALKHGLRAQKHIVLPGENAAEFAALEAALLEELAPQGALQAVLARRVVAATWRLERAERIEAGLFAHHLRGERNLGLALIRDGNGPRAFDTLLRYRGGTLAELWRALRTLKALQAEQAAQLEPTVAPEPRALPEPHEMPIEPDVRGNPRQAMSAAPADAARMSAEADADVRHADHRIGPRPCPQAGMPPDNPNGPEARTNPGEIAPASAADAEGGRLPGDLGAQEATQGCVILQHLRAGHAPRPADSA